MRIAPGVIPPTTVPPADLRVAAEGYVDAHLNEQNYREIKSGAELKRVKTVVERLSTAAGYPSKTFPVHLVDAGQEVNAAAFNGASIVVYEELLRRVPSDEQLATVLAHEIGHIVAKHYADQAEEEQRASSVQLGSSLLGSVAGIATSAAGYDGVSDIAGSVTETTAGAIGYGAFVGAFNRTQEYEADHLGLLIMAKAGYNPQSAIEFWTGADKVFGASTSSTGAFFSTHPASSDRMVELEKALPLAMQYYSPVSNPTGSKKGSTKKK